MLESPELKQRTAAITQKYLAGKTLEGFASGLGIGGVSKQSVNQWELGHHSPNMIMLFRVINCSLAYEWAKNWAYECLTAYEMQAEMIELVKQKPNS